MSHLTIIGRDVHSACSEPLTGRAGFTVMATSVPGGQQCPQEVFTEVGLVPGGLVHRPEHAHETGQGLVVLAERTTASRQRLLSEAAGRLPMDHNTGAGHPYPADAGASQRPTAPAAQGVNVLRWRQVLRGEAGQLRVLRRWLVSMLPDCPARDDVISVATELASNALRHTASGRGGWFAVEITRYPSVIRIAVAGQGGPG
jgi:hypothetical protein